MPESGYIRKVHSLNLSLDRGAILNVGAILEPKSLIAQREVTFLVERLQESPRTS